MIRAMHFPDFGAFRSHKTPGSFHVDGLGSPIVRFIVWCPCGCGHRWSLTVGENCKPTASPSWRWNGSLTEPTLDPSVRDGDVDGEHWHGWLRNGYWEAA